jgi:hypothetical protein
MRFSTCLRQMGHSDMRSPHIWHVPCPQRKIMFLRRSKHTGHMVCSLMSCSCCCNFCMSELDVSRLPLFIRHTGSTGTPPDKESRRHYFQNFGLTSLVSTSDIPNLVEAHLRFSYSSPPPPPPHHHPTTTIIIIPTSTTITISIMD